MTGKSESAHNANETKKEESGSTNKSSHGSDKNEGRGSNLSQEDRRKGGENSHSGSDK